MLKMSKDWGIKMSGCFRIALAILALGTLSMVCLESAVGQEDVASIEQGSAKEPFDVSGAVIYRIPIHNDIGSSMRYTVELKVGPDSSNYSIFDVQVKDVNVNAHSDSAAAFSVNFGSPQLSQGEFGIWAKDRNDTSIWERSWYHAEIKPLVGDVQVVESYDGHPALRKTIFDFKRAEVTPTQGSNSDLYSYKVDVFGSYNDNISLQVAPSSEGPWTDMGSREYSTPGLTQTLAWKNVTLSFDFTMAYYRFKGVRQSKAMEGPFWPVVMDVGNASVTPPRGLSNSKFNYRLQLISSKGIDVGLNVLDIGSKTFQLAGRISYKNASRKETVEWKGVQPSEVAGSEGRSSYYFTFYYPGSETPFNRTRQYPGPDIILVSFENNSVSPKNGSGSTRFTYCVDLNTALPRCDVELQTSPLGASKWTSQGIISYDGSSKRLCWKDIVLDGEISGNGRYRFICGQSVSEVYSGPEIAVPELVGTVLPVEGVLQAFPETNNLYTFTYAAEFRNWTADNDTWVELLVRAPNSSWKAIGERKQLDPARGNVTWTAKPFGDVEFLGKAEFRFLVNGKESEIYDGPAIFALYKDLDFKDGGAGKFDYSASVTGSENLQVDLLSSTDNEKWTDINKSKSYAGGSGWQNITWTDLPAYYFYELDVRREGGEKIYDA
jgi:hypothetical protein